jgi:hypothetical protein
MENLEEILLELHNVAENTGKDVFVDTDIYDRDGFYIVVTEDGRIGAFGTVIDEENNAEQNIFLVLDDKKIKYLNDEGFTFSDFYKVMGEKLFKKLDKVTFISEMTK